MSASAPAGRARSITGKLSAASTSATIEGDAESEVINQPDPTSCIQVPMLETTVAIHRLRKSAFCKGRHGELSAFCEFASNVGPDFAPNDYGGEKSHTDKKANIIALDQSQPPT